ncbi:MAG: CsiV family protein, partial [Thiogranum sp.]
EAESEYGVPEIRLRQQRRMRSKELHYFDHPRFGVIALITPYQPEPEPEPEPQRTDIPPAAQP